MTDKLKIWLIAGLGVIVAVICFLLRQKSIRLQALNHELTVLKLDNSLRVKQEELIALQGKFTQGNFTISNRIEEITTNIANLESKRRTSDAAYKNALAILDSINKRNNI
jgi:hypothetical protein